MAPETRKQIIDLLQDMKLAAATPEARANLDQLAVNVISQDHRPQVMADNLAYWFRLSNTARLAA